MRSSALVFGLLVSSVAAAAFAEVGPQHLRYLSGWKVGDTSKTVIAQLGTPDFVILPTDSSEEGQALKRDGIAKQFVWLVRGCQPVRMDFDRSSQSTGVNFSALSGTCIKAAESLLRPASTYACVRDDRRSYCR